MSNNNNPNCIGDLILIVDSEKELMYKTTSLCINIQASNYNNKGCRNHLLNGFCILKVTVLGGTAVD